MRGSGAGGVDRVPVRSPLRTLAALIRARWVNACGKLPAAGDVVLLGVQAQVVAQSLPGTLPGPAAYRDLRRHEAFITDKRPYRRRPFRWLADGWAVSGPG